MHGWVSTRSLLLLAALLPGAAAADGLGDLNLETHGFVSFGYLKSWGNNWVGDTREGTDEFWEAGANVIARPVDHLRLGAQLFARDLGDYGDGDVTVDWAYADWRFADELGVQVGRVKLPVGLHGDAIDVDAAHASVFLPRFVYPTRAREILLSTDGGKAYGTVGPCDWVAYLGNRELSADGDFARYLAYANGFDRVTDLESEFVAGGMLHWRTPLPGLEARLSGIMMHGLEAHALAGNGAVAIDLSVPEWYVGVASLAYEMPGLTWNLEYSRFHAPTCTTVTPVGGGPSQQARGVLRDESAYLSLTWHARRWLDVYGAIEGYWDDPADRHGSAYQQSVVAAIAVMPTAHWSLKAEYRYWHGPKDVDPNLNPGGIARDTQLLALKTTVDF
jgi:hypothetical protein